MCANYCRDFITKVPAINCSLNNLLLTSKNMGCVESQVYTFNCIVLNANTFRSISQDLRNTLCARNYAKDFKDDNKILIAIPKEYPELLNRVLRETMFSNNMVTQRSYQKTCCGWKNASEE